MEWQSVTKQVLISPGTYRLVIGANANSLMHLPGSWWSDALLDSTVAFTAVCVCDINNDGLIDDTDFIQFIAAYDLLLCDNPDMPSGCKADFNNDGVVDDSDFQTFIAQYDMLICR